MTKEQFKHITEWQVKTFEHASAVSKIEHLKEEVDELLECLTFEHAERAETESEFADCFTLLFGAAASYGMNYEDICNAINRKMEINYKRKWGKAEKNGVVHHVKGCDNWMPDKSTSATRCLNCGKDRWTHEL